MRIYSWKTLLITILAGGGGLVCSAVRLFYDRDLFGVLWAVIFLIGIYRGIQASMTKKGYETDLENGQKGKLVYRALFGTLAPVMPYGGLICFVTAGILVWLFPMHLWAGLCFIAAALVYQIWLFMAVRRELKRLESEK